MTIGKKAWTKEERRIKCPYCNKTTKIYRHDFKAGFNPKDPYCRSKIESFRRYRCAECGRRIPDNKDFEQKHKLHQTIYNLLYNRLTYSEASMRYIFNTKTSYYRWLHKFFKIIGAPDFEYKTTLDQKIPQRPFKARMFKQNLSPDEVRTIIKAAFPDWEN